MRGIPFLSVKYTVAALMTTNPYLENRNIWNNLLGGVALSNRVLRYSLFLMIATNTALAVDLIYESKRNETKPYLIVLNQDLNPLAMEYAEEYKSADTNVVRAFLARFVTDLRSISADMEVLNKQYQRLYSMLTSGSQAYNVISDNFKKDSPIVIAENETRSVEVKSVIKQSSLSLDKRKRNSV
jgi:type IV secretory pathway TrbF-like protein